MNSFICFFARCCVEKQTDGNNNEDPVREEFQVFHAMSPLVAK
jgi:hypothetical protein